MSLSVPGPAQESIVVGQISIRYLIDGTATGGMGIFEMIVPPNSMVPPPHSHTGHEECIYVLEGTLRYSVDDTMRNLGPAPHFYQLVIPRETFASRRRTSYIL